MYKKILSWLLAFIMITTMFGGIGLEAYGQSYTDIETHWAKSEIEEWTGKGLLSGYSDGAFKPNDYITRAEFITLINNAINIQAEKVITFDDIEGNEWYYKDLKRAVYGGYIAGYEDNTFRANGNITRQEVAVILQKIVQQTASEEESLKLFYDTENIPDWSKPALLLAVQKGYLSGYTDNSLRASSFITRAESVQVLSNLFGVIYNQAGVYGPNVDEGILEIKGNVTVSVENITLQNMVIDGDLYLAEGIGEGDVTLDNITVTGETIVKGGGTDSIIITGHSVISSIVIVKVDGALRVFAEDGTEVGKVIVDGKDDVILEGVFEEITIFAGDITVWATEAEIDTAEVVGENSKIVIQENTTAKRVILSGTRTEAQILGNVEQFETTEEATDSEITVEIDGKVDIVVVNSLGTRIKGEGTVDKVLANANGVVVETIGAEVTAGAGIVGVMAGDKEVPEKETEIVGDEPATGGSAGGTSRPPATVEVSAISINEADQELTVGNELQLTVTFTPESPTNTGRTWATSETAIASVSDTGLVTAVSAGNVTITVTSSDSDFTDTMAITVVDPVYTVTYDGNGNTSGAVPTDENEYEESDIVTVLENTGSLQKTGYLFAGWNTEADGSGTDYAVDYTFDIGTDDVTLYARWTVIDYTITYDLDGGMNGSNPTAYNIETETITLLDATKTAYTFAGWYDAATGGNQVEAIAQGSTGDMTLYAKWTAIEYTITYVLDGGTNGANPASYNIETETINLVDAAKIGYTFAGWYDAATGGNQVTTIAQVSTGNKTLYARWTANEYTITFDSAGGTVIGPITQDYGTVVTSPADPIKEGYTFAGWNRTVPGTMPAENLTLTAQWTINQYTITFDSNGGSTVEPITQNYGTEITPPADPTREGYAFAGWSSAVPTTMPGENITLIAQWTANFYTITFNTNGGSNLSAVSKIVPYDGPYGTLPTVSRTGYTFDGWFTEVSGGNKIEEVTIVSTADDHMLYAQWLANTDTAYQVEHYQQDVLGDGYTLADTDNLTGTTDQSATAQANSYTGFNENTAHVDRVASGSIAGDGSLVLKLYYDRETYTVTYDNNGADSGTVPTDTNSPYRYAATVTLLDNTDLAKTGKVFGGWNTQAAGSGTGYSANDTFTIEADMILYAVWSDPVLESIAITTQPAKTEYKVGEDLDITGLVVTGTYSDGSTQEETITLDNISGFDSTAVIVEQILTVTVEGKTATYPISVIQANGPALTGVTADDDANTLTGITADMEYSTDGTTWIACVTEPSNLPDLTGTLSLQVRVAETDTHTAGLATTFEFTVEASIASVAATNGIATITLEAVPTVAPVEGDFTATVAIDGGEAVALVLTNFTYDDNVTVTYDFAPIPESETEQSVVVAVTLAGTETLSPAFTIAELVLGANGTLLDAKAGTDFTGALYTREGNIYYNQQDTQDKWIEEVLIGAGIGGSLAIDSAGNPHVAYVTDAPSGYDAIGYRKVDAGSWTAEVLIESNGNANCSKPDIALDNNGFAHITYTDPRGNTSTSYNDIMYATNIDGSFVRTIAYRGYYGSFFSGSYDWNYFNKGSYITLDDSNQYYIMTHERQGNRNSWGDTFNNYRVWVNSTNISGNNGSDDRDIHDLFTKDGKLYALYRAGTEKVTEITVTDGSITNTEDVIVTDITSAYSHDINSGDIVIGSKDGSNLQIHYNGVKLQPGTFNVGGNAVSVINLNGIFYAYYTDANDGNIIKKIEIQAPPQITGVDINNEVQNISVPYGTAEADAISTLADEITIKDSNEGTYIVSLNWSIANFNPNTAGNYTATGTFDLPVGVAPNPMIDLEVTATVTVEEGIEITAIEGIVGIPEMGEVLTAGALTPAGAIVDYQWQLQAGGLGDWTNIIQATADTYTVSSPVAVGDHIRVVATGTGNYTGTVTSTGVPIAATLVTGITLTSENDITKMVRFEDNTLQLHAEIEPLNATDNSVTWSLLSGGAYAEIDQNGLVTINNHSYDLGWITVKAEANDGSGLLDTMSIEVITGSSIGDRGPAGGVVFYDKGNYNGGWRYLEASDPNEPLHSQNQDWKNIQTTWSNNTNTLVGTSTVMGSGRANTELIMSEAGHSASAAKIASEHWSLTNDGHFEDWFLPSRDELQQIYSVLFVGNLVSFDVMRTYWSSSELEVNKALAHSMSFSIPDTFNEKSDWFVYVWPIRAF